jgi:serine phosphatase RsbU (regulator of sigma subunit)
MHGSRAGTLALNERQLAAALDKLDVPVTVQAPDGRMRFANQAALDRFGFVEQAAFLAVDVASLLLRFRPELADGTPLTHDDIAATQRALHGEPAEPLLLRWADPGTGAAHWGLIRSTPLFDDDGTPIGAVHVLEDVTQASDAAVAQRILDEAAGSLASSLDYELTLQHVAQLAVPRLADWCGVDLLGPHGQIMDVAVAHVDPERVRLAREFRRRYPVSTEDENGVGAVFRVGATALSQDITDAMLVATAQDDEHLAILRALMVRSSLIVPLSVAGRVIGGLTLVRSEAGRPFSAADIALVQELGRRAGAAVHNARLYTERGQIAHALQASMLPRELPQMVGWRTALHHRAAGYLNEVGGDLYDIAALADGRWLVLVGDVVGKGAGAAALTPRVRHTIATATALTGDPRDGMLLLDGALAAEPDTAPMLCTAATVVLEEREDGGALARIVCAGHPAPVLVRDGRARLMGPIGRMLGLGDADHRRDHEDVELRRGDVLVLFTDGVTEAGTGGDRFGVERLCAALEAAGPDVGAQELIDAVRAALGDFAGGDVQDDTLLLAVERC